MLGTAGALLAEAAVDDGDGDVGESVPLLVPHCGIGQRQDEEGERSLPELPAPDAGPERQALAAEIRQRTDAALAELSPSERAAFVLRHYEGRSIAEISSAHGKRDNATKQSIFRAVRKLRSALAPLAPWIHQEFEESLHEEPA